MRNSREVLTFFGNRDSELGVFDFTSVFTFLAVAVLYFLAPALGYRSDRRRFLAASLWLFLASAALALTQMTIQYSLLKSISTVPNPMTIFGGSEELWLQIGLLKAILFVVAMVFLVFGLHTLQLVKNKE